MNEYRRQAFLKHLIAFNEIGEPVNDLPTPDPRTVCNDAKAVFGDKTALPYHLQTVFPGGLWETYDDAARGLVAFLVRIAREVYDARQTRPHRRG